MQPALLLTSLLAATLIAVVELAGATPEPGFDWRLPPGVAPPPTPADNPMSAAKVELGRRLFYDADLSVDGTMACATCHEQHRAFTEGNRTHPGVKDSKGRRNVMALVNVGYLTPLTWARPDLLSLESQVIVPVTGDHPVEMGMAGKEQVLADRLAANPCYRKMFAASFPAENGRIAMTTIAKALAAFERTLLSFDSPYDRHRRGDASVFDDAATRGEALFFGDRLRCAGCHSGPNFTDGKFHNLGLDAGFADDHGLREATNDPADDGRFRTPSLRNVALTGPYLRDGRASTISEAVALHFAAGDGGGPNSLRDAALPSGMLGHRDLADLVHFLDSLTDQGFVTDPRFALPKTACGENL
jgi:cytochrome c peroxidase